MTASIAKVIAHRARKAAVEPHGHVRPNDLAGWSVTLSYSAGTTLAFTATANQTVSSTGYTINIIDQTSATTLSTCATGMTCTASSVPTTAQDVYYAQVSSSSVTAATSSAITPPGWAIALAGTLQGNYFAMSAASNYNVASSGLVLHIWDQNSGLELAQCTTGTTCSTLTSPSRLHSTYFATVSSGSSAYPPSGVVATSTAVIAPDWTIALGNVYQTQANTMTATTNYDTFAVHTPVYTEVFDLSTSSQGYVGYCAGSSSSSAVTISGEACRLDPTVPATRQDIYVAVIATTLTNTWSQMQSSGGILGLSGNLKTLPYALTMVGNTMYWNYDPNLGGPALTIAYDLDSQGTVTNYVAVCKGNLASPAPGSRTSDNAYGCTIVPPNCDPIIAVIGSSQNRWQDISNPAAVAYGGGCGAGSGDASSSEACGGCAGDPVATENGDLSEPFKDITVPGDGPGLALGRTYSSRHADVDGPFGPGWTFTYGMYLRADTVRATSAGNAIDVVEEDGSIAAFTPDRAGNYTPDATSVASLVHNSNGSWTFTRKHRQVFTFSADGTLAAVSDLNGKSTVMAYASGRLSAVTDASGRSLTFTYWPDGHVQAVRDPAGQSVQYGYDSAGRLGTVTNRNGKSTQFGYTDSGDPDLLTSITRPAGGSVTNSYDAFRRVHIQTSPTGGQTQFDYAVTSTTSTTTITNPSGHIEVHTYTNGELTDVTRASGTALAGTWHYTYDPSTREPASLQDPLGHLWQWTYNADGNVLSAKDPLNRQTTYTYNALGQPLTIKDPNLFTTTYTYDAAGNVQTISRPLVGTSPLQTAVASYRYDDPTHPGDVTSAKNPDDNITSFTYDAAGDLHTIALPNGETTTAAYDSLGRMTSVQDGRMHTTVFDYWPDGQRKSVTDPDTNTTTYTYDADGNLRTATDPYLKQTSYDYDLADRPTVTHRPDGKTLQTLYNVNGDMSEQIDAANDTTFYDYNVQDQVQNIEDPDGNVSSSTYNSAGQLTGYRKGAWPITFGYTAAGQLNSVTYANGSTPSVGYTYYDNGQRKTMADGTGTTSYNYDSLDRTTKIVTGSGATTQYGYDLAGNTTSITYPDGHIVNRGYDTDNRLHTVKDWNNNTTTYAAYDGDSNPTSELFPNGVKTATSYDLENRVTEITDTNAANTVLADWAYQRQNTGDLNTATTTGNSISDPTHTYGYTANRALTSDTTTSGATAFTPNTADQVATLGATTLNYDPSGQLTTTTNTSTNITTNYEFDGDGNRTSATQTGTALPQKYAYDQADRLTSTQSDAEYVPMASTRIYNTTAGSGYPGAGIPLTAGQTVSVAVAGALNNTIPATGITAVAVNITIVSDTAATSITAFSAGAARPTGLTLHSPGVNSPVNNMATLLLGTSGVNAGKISLYNSLGTTNVAVDVEGYYTTDGSQYVPLTPTRIVNTRTGSGLPYAGSHIPAHGTLDVKVAGAQVGTTTVVPAAATGALVEVTIGNPSSAGEFHLYPTGSTPQTGNSFSFTAGATITQQASVAVGTNGNVTVLNTSSATADVLIDVVGYFISSATASSFHPLPSTRIVDTRTGSAGPYAGQHIPAGGTLIITAKGLGGVPSYGATAITAVVSFISGTTHSWITTYPSNATRPGTDTVVFQGTLSTNQSTIELSPTGQFTLYNSGAAAADVSVDVLGYYHNAENTYTYNGDGLRTSATNVSSTAAATTTAFTYDTTTGTPQLLTDGTTDYVYGLAGQPLEQVVSATGATTYLHHDQLGSTRLVTNSSGAVTGTYTYDPYGNTTSHTGTATTPLQYSGAYNDAATGLYYLIHRYYDPATAQFLTVDPLVAATRTPYQYVNNTPLNATDPTGLYGFGDFLKDVGSAVGYIANVVYCQAKQLFNFAENHPWWALAIVAGGMFAAWAIPAFLEGAEGAALVDGETAAAEDELAGQEAAAADTEGTTAGKAMSQLDRTGSGLKSDVLHRSASWVVDDSGAQQFTIRGGDGVSRQLYQLPGEVNGKPGVFEWMVDDSGTDPVITHQRFINGGSVTGYPNQRP